MTSRSQSSAGLHSVPGNGGASPVNPEFARILKLWSGSQLVAVKASREPEQMVFPRGDFAQLTRKDERDVLGVPLYGSLVNPIGGR